MTKKSNNKETFPIDKKINQKVMELGFQDLIVACKNGNKETVELLLKKGVDIDIKDRYGNTPLMLASSNGHLEVLELLLDTSLNIDIQDKKGRTALILASENGHTDVVDLLLALESDIHIQDKKGQTALILASENGYTHIVELLLALEADTNIQDKKGTTALMTASAHGHTSIVELLLTLESDIHIQDKKGTTALMLASAHGHIEVVELLLTLESNININNTNGYTALMFSSQNGHLEIVKLLLSLGSKPDIKAKNGWTASIIASQNGYTEIVELLSKFEKNDRSKGENMEVNAESDPHSNREDIEIESDDLKNIKMDEKKLGKDDNNLEESKKIFIVKKFFKSYFSKRLDKEKFEEFLYKKGLEILENNDYRNLCHGDRIKKLRAENKIFELRINSGDRLIFTFKEEGIIFICVDNHDNAVKKGKNTEIDNLMELSAKVEEISEINTSELVESPIFEYTSMEEVERSYDEYRELYKLTEEQQNIVNQKLPICLYGSAGSGKTTMLLKKVERLLRSNGDLKILFLTHNKRLLRYTKGLYETYSGYKLKQITFKDINEFFRDETSLLEEDYFTYEDFYRWFNEKSGYNTDLKELSVLEVFSEIKGIIKGFVGVSGRRDLKKENLISKGYYMTLRKKYSLLKVEDDRELVYELALEYEKHLKNIASYDENDLAIRYLRDESKTPEYDFLACDEVQDLTELQLLGTLKVIKDKKNVFLTGDNNQAINLSFFDFSRLVTLYHENYNFKEIENSQISINQRSSEKIVGLAKKIADIREIVLPANKRVNYKEETLIKGGNMPVLAPLNIKELSQLENKDITVIVPNTEMKKKIGKNYNNTILTVYEVKGLERENIICVGLVDYFKEDAAEIVRSLNNNNISEEKLPNHYRHFFNLFYVAVTRARKNLVFLDNIENKFFNSLEEEIYKSTDEYWLDSFVDIEDISDDKLLKYAKEFEEKGLYFEALKNYEKMNENVPKYISRVKSFINYEAKNYLEALDGFDILEMWNECLDCVKKLKDENKITKYQIKVYEKEKNYLSLAQLYYSNLQFELAFNSFIDYFRREEKDGNDINEDYPLFFDIVSKIEYQNIRNKDKTFILNNLSSQGEFYKLALDILVIDKRYKEAKEILRLKAKKNIEDEFKLFLLKNNGTTWEKSIDGLNIKGESELYKNYYLNSDLSELNVQILKKMNIETLDMFIKNGFIGSTGELDKNFIEKILNLGNQNLINYYLLEDDNRNNYIEGIENYLEEYLKKNSVEKFLKRAEQLLDKPYDFILRFSEKDEIKTFINNQLRLKKVGLDIFKESYNNLIEFDSYVKMKNSGEYNTDLVLDSLDYNSFELEDLMGCRVDGELDGILEKTGKLLPRELFEKLSREDKIKYREYYVSYIEEQVNTKVTVINLSKEKKALKIDGKYLKDIDPMTKIILDVEDSVTLSLGIEERKVFLEDIVVGEDKIIFK